MPGSHPVRWIILLCGALAAFGCANTDTNQGATGSLSLDLVLAGGIEIDVVDWAITGNGMDMEGSIDVSASGSTASVEVYGLPVGQEPYVVELSAVSVDEEVTCRGSAEFDVEVGVPTPVMVILNCKLPQELGSVRVNGKFNICTELTKVVVSPLQTSVGNDISLSAQAFDEEGDDIHYIWTGDGGSIADPSAASTTYTCQDVGEHMVTILVTDNDVYCRMATWTVPVTCVPGDVIDLCEDVECPPDGNQCTEAACEPSSGECVSSNLDDGTLCDIIGVGDGICSNGQCVEIDLCEGVVCDDDNECTADACNPADGTCSSTNVDDGTSCADDAGTCIDGACVVIIDKCEGVVCDDTGNECTVAMCNTTTGECDTMNVADGTACNGGVGACSAGACIDNNPCEGVDCTSDNDCVQDGTCDPADGLCDPGDPQPADTACDLGGTDDGFCDGAGACVACNADAQCPDDGNECTAETCTSNACSSSPIADGTMCDNDTGVCDQGTCVAADLCEGVDCSDGNECTQDLCDPATGDCSNPAEADGTMCVCPICGADGLCDMGVCVDPCDGVDCSDGNQCTADLCNVGVCSNPNVGPGAGCDQDGGNVCDGSGTCVECISDAQCASGEACVDNVCVPNATANAFIKTLDPNNGFQTSLIDTVDTTNLPDTWGGYTASITIPDDDAFINQVLQFGFQNNASNFQSSGVFYDNVVLNPGPEYTQDFDSFDITVTPIGDGWLFFNNVFDSAGNRKFGYNGLAPNATADTDPSDGETFISAIVDDQGGAGQGTQQLSVFSDYNCCGAGTTNEGHFGTDLVEVNVFQERRLTADDLGVTLEFIFEAKAGNIGQ